MIQQFLRSVSLFRELDDEELAQVLMVGMLKRYTEGVVILTEGTPGGQLHVIHQGRVRISRGCSGLRLRWDAGQLVKHPVDAPLPVNSGKQLRPPRPEVRGEICSGAA